MTNDEIKRILDDKGIAYPKNAKKNELEKLLGGAPDQDGEAAGTEAVDDDGVDGREGAAEPYEVRVTAALLNVRCEPSLSAEVARTARKGETLEAVGAEDGWVELSDGCYVMERFAERL